MSKGVLDEGMMKGGRRGVKRRGEQLFRVSVGQFDG